MKYIRLSLLSFFASLSLIAFSQYTNTLYFMNELNGRNEMNPAFLPHSISYFDFILLPNVYAGVGQNAFSLRDLAAISKLEKNWPSKSSRINVNAKLGILNFGFRIKQNHYMTFVSGINIDAVGYASPEMLQLLFKGMSAPKSKGEFSSSIFDFDANAYAYCGLGYSGKIASKINFGIKAKAIIGLSNISSQAYDFELIESHEKMMLTSHMKSNIAMCLPFKYQYNDRGSIDFSTLGLGNFSQFSPAGYGAAIDLGLSYEPIENLVLSASVTDLGVIYWCKNSLTRLHMSNTSSYDGLPMFSLNSKGKFSNQIIEKLNECTDSISIGSCDNYYSDLNGKFFAGIEYGVLNNKISFGLVNRMTFNSRHIYDELTLAINFRPVYCFNAAISYSFIDGNFGSLGLGLNLNLGGVNMFLLADYVPLTWSKVYSEKRNKNISLPEKVGQLNLQVGMAFSISNIACDFDQDRISNRKDKCPEQDLSYILNAHPKLKMKDIRDKNGCLKDADEDGVPDAIDKCPNTPIGVIVDSVGCPLDSDNDGVPDYIDVCPETPANLEVTKSGCPLDSDNDGVPDYKDECPNTPLNADVDKSGCPLDSDNDGVPDYKDECPGTPPHTPVDSKGCPYVVYDK